MYIDIIIWMLFWIPMIGLRYQNELLHCTENLIYYVHIDFEYTKIVRQRSVSFFTLCHTHVYVLKNKNYKWLIHLLKQLDTIVIYNRNKVLKNTNKEDLLYQTIPCFDVMLISMN